MAYSEVVLEHFQRRRNEGAFEESTHTGRGGTPGDGPFITLHFQVEGGAILRAQYETYGCPAAVSTASVVCELLTGRPVKAALALEAMDISVLLRGLPDGKEDRPHLAITAIQQALGEFS